MPLKRWGSRTLSFHFLPYVLLEYFRKTYNYSNFEKLFHILKNFIYLTAFIHSITISWTPTVHRAQCVHGTHTPLPRGGGKALRGKAGMHRSAVSGNALTTQLSRCYEPIQQDSVREKGRTGKPKTCIPKCHFSWNQNDKKEKLEANGSVRGRKGSQSPGYERGHEDGGSTQDWGRPDLAQRGGSHWGQGTGWALARSHPSFKDLFGST